jgi:Uma2 family endonuclease
MRAIAERTRYTPEDLLTIPEVAKGAEVRAIAGEVFYRLRAFHDETHGGLVFPPGIMYECTAEGRTWVLKPDVSFIRCQRLPGGRVPKGPIPVAPELAVDVVSPTDLCSKVTVRVEEYLAAGVGIVWSIAPVTRRAYIYYPDAVVRLDENDNLSAEELFPGFRIRVGDILPAPETADDAS